MLSSGVSEDSYSTLIPVYWKKPKFPFELIINLYSFLVSFFLSQVFLTQASGLTHYIALAAFLSEVGSQC